MSILQSISQAVIKGMRNEIVPLVESALAEGTSAAEVINRGLVEGMRVVGERFKQNEIFIPEVLLSARSMRVGMELLRPLLTNADAERGIKVVLGTVQGDLHDIGKDMVGMMLEGAGFRIIDLGVNVAAEKFMEAVRKEKVAILGMSALLSSTIPYLKTTIDALMEAGLRNQVKVMVGGAPVTQEYAIRIGADGYATDAATAVDVAKNLLGL